MAPASIWEIEQLCILQQISRETFSFGWQEWTNDQIENEMEIVLDTVNKLRSLRPSTDTYERFVQVHAMCYLCQHCVTDDVPFNLILLIHLNLIPYFLFAPEQTSCFCALPRLGGYCHHTLLPFLYYNTCFCVIS